MSSVNKDASKYLQQLASDLRENGRILRMGQVELELSESGDHLFLSLNVCERVPSNWVEGIYHEEDERSAGIESTARVCIGEFSSAEILRLAASMVQRVADSGAWAVEDHTLRSAESLLLDMAQVEQTKMDSVLPIREVGETVPTGFSGRSHRPFFPFLVKEPQPS